MVFKILFRSWVICKNLKRPGFYTQGFYVFIDYWRCKQNKQNLEHPFVGIGKSLKILYVWKISAKILNSMVVGARQSFQIFETNNLDSLK